MRVGMPVVVIAALLGLTAGCAAAEDSPAPAPSSVATITDFTKTHPDWLTTNHVKGKISYPMSPPVGGDHNRYWQNCMGDVYPEAIANEHAVHSLEHGAVWVTYRPGLDEAEVKTLADRVDGRQYLFMSPYPGLKTEISLQAWGFQLTTDSASDTAIDAFIRDHRGKGAPEPGAPCSGGVTDTGTTPFEG